jgi:hypothetical protein
MYSHRRAFRTCPPYQQKQLVHNHALRLCSIQQGWQTHTARSCASNRPTQADSPSSHCPSSATAVSCREPPSAPASLSHTTPQLYAGCDSCQRGTEPCTCSHLSVAVAPVCMCTSHSMDDPKATGAHSIHLTNTVEWQVGRCWQVQDCLCVRTVFRMWHLLSRNVCGPATYHWLHGSALCFKEDRRSDPGSRGGTAMIHCRD